MFPDGIGNLKSLEPAALDHGEPSKIKTGDKFKIKLRRTEFLTVYLIEGRNVKEGVIHARV